MKKFKLNRKSVAFEYEFMDGSKVEFTYKEPTTMQIDKGVDIEGLKEKLAYIKESLKDCLVSKTDGAIDRLIDEQIEDGNLYDFKLALDEELGKLKKRG